MIASQHRPSLLRDQTDYEYTKSHYHLSFRSLAEKAIRIEVVVDPARAAAHIAQVQAAKAPSAGPAAQRAVAAVRGGGAARGRGRGRGGRGGVGGRVKQPKKSVEDLDAEMEDYATKADA